MGNIVLLQFLVGLKQATEDELVAELVVNVLKASPDILSRYFKETQYSYSPRVKSAWQDNVKLLKKVTYVYLISLNTAAYSCYSGKGTKTPALVSGIMFYPSAH